MSVSEVRTASAGGGGGEGAVVCGEVEDAWHQAGEQGADGGEGGADQSDADFNRGPDCGVAVVPGLVGGVCEVDEVFEADHGGYARAGTVSLGFGKDSGT